MCAFRLTLMQRGGGKAFIDFVSKLPKGLSPQERAAKYREIHGSSKNTTTNQQISTSSLYRAFLKKRKGQLPNMSFTYRVAVLRRRFYALSQQEMEELKALVNPMPPLVPKKRKRYGSQEEYQDFLYLQYPMAVGKTHHEKMRHVAAAWRLSKEAEKPKKKRRTPKLLASTGHVFF